RACGRWISLAGGCLCRGGVGSVVRRCFIWWVGCWSVIGARRGCRSGRCGQRASVCVDATHGVCSRYTNRKKENEMTTYTATATTGQTFTFNSKAKTAPAFAIIATANPDALRAAARKQVADILA